jgi:hypothetical protein
MSYEEVEILGMAIIGNRRTETYFGNPNEWFLKPWQGKLAVDGPLSHIVKSIGSDYTLGYVFFQCPKIHEIFPEKRH